MSGTLQRGRRGRLPAVVLAALLVLAGALALGVALHAQQSPPQPPASAAVTPPAGAPRSAAVPAPPASTTVADPGGQQPPATRGLLLPAAVPTHVEVPAIGVSSDLMDLGLNPDGTVEVPPLAENSQAGWFTGSPTPGALGPAVLLGHVDSAEYGPGIFFDLGDLVPGDEITVTREDGTAAVFAVDRVVSYPKDSFPTLEVYGNTDNAALRLITCGGQFDAGTRNYLDNIVAYASLVSSHPA
ncbi:class F sortase [Modestobacter excelsi]|uniref:class F sortase n=1 Tax=Modestobacter excelsi TaxID=2213161 RepID=UPI00110D041F|nr:class F sortase [Modestobacter excelsi]